jgi:hypothetical protein
MSTSRTLEFGMTIPCLPNAERERSWKKVPVVSVSNVIAQNSLLF